ncbi:MAG: uroporphyrinogen decarboxylase family protein, partial [Cytophagales bacterium]
PLIGFAGAPWTIFSYVIEGSGTKTFTKPRVWLYQHPEWSHLLLQKITDSTKDYLLAQVKAGANLIQLFDSWAGVLSPEQYNEFALPYISQLCDALSPLVPVTVFSKGANGSLKEISQTSCSTVGIDWCISRSEAKKLITGKTIQGNLDPCALFSDKFTIEKFVAELIEDFSDVPHIVNLGHGLYPETPKENVKHFVQTVKSFELIKN